MSTFLSIIAGIIFIPSPVWISLWITYRDNKLKEIPKEKEPTVKISSY